MKNEDYGFLSSDDLSYACKGVLVRILKNKNISSANALRTTRDGATSVSTCLKKLTALGYLHRFNFSGRMTYIASTTPITDSQSKLIYTSRLADEARKCLESGVAARSLDAYAERAYIYVLHAPGGRYKIGSSTAPSDRLYQIQCAHPDGNEITMNLAIESYRRVEFMLHDYFADKRIKGEWFKLAESDVLLIAELIPKLEATL